MKRPKQSPLDIFKNESTTIDPKFRTELKKQLLQPAKKKKQAYWPRYVLATTAFMVVLLAVSITGLNRPGSKQLFGPEKVSAAELLRRAEVASKNFDFTKYNYFELRSEDNTGPGIQNLKCSDPSYQTFKETAAFTMYAYRAHDGVTEAYYDTASKDGEQINSTAVYDETPEVVIDDYLLSRNNDLSNMLNTWVVDGQPNNLIVDSSGREVTDDRVLPTKLNGKTVYEFFTKDNPNSSASVANQQAGCYNSIVNHIVIDADSSLVLVMDSYLDGYADSSLIQAHHYDYVNENTTAQNALERMTAVGFNKETALAKYPEAHD